MDSLGVNLPGLITQVISFVILFFILHRLLYKPILKMLDHRSNRIKESLDAAQQAKDEMLRSQEEVRGQLEAARAEGQQMIAKAQEVADRYREEELAKAKGDIETERERAQVDIQRERDSAIEEVRREFAGLAINAAERIVARSLDEAAHKELIEEVLDDASKSTSN